MKKRSHIGELGGFAESPDVLEEGTEEAQEAFNYCLASDYIDAIYGEDFESLGCIDHCLLDDILMWYQLGGGSLSLEDEEKIMRGNVITNGGRTLLEAVLEDRNDCLARTFICNGNNDSRLYALCVVEDEWAGLLNSHSDMNRLDYLQFLKGIFDLVEEDYAKTSGEDKIRMISCIRKNIMSIRFSKEIGPIKISDDIGSYQFVKDINREK